MPIARPDLTMASWRKSTHSQGGGGCVEIAEQYPGVTPVRDSKDTSRTPVVVPRAAWGRFVTAVVATHGDLST
ncbi:DUF397 domain-containing protein [Streptomyces sp. UNOC14_S4]|uniref:DUF397 domain-containing protein n=1 Tax=Streptomyces sp. UNOC14_S4 TaxID=2872340 RepID=UPI001E48F18B|nr:DUF397 domain-containing protein [Streptomyces sp. UNOC14_S4]MCC3767642.1 DUF397 domain-containing protein [Streptomyces sp. UNOC14_S4]